MNLNQVSVGGGLGLVALGLFVNAGALLAGGGSKAALGDGARQGAGLAGPEGSAWSGGPPIAAPRRMSMGGADGCVEGAPLDWFGAIRELPPCQSPTGEWGVPSLDSSAADVNGDGTMEYFVHGYQVAKGGVPIEGQCAFGRFQSHLEGDLLVKRRECLLTTDTLATWVLARTGIVGDVYVYFGWNDLDSDGDLDLLVNFYSYESGKFPRAWLENTGFEATLPLTGDLNHDGAVNSADLTMLLGGWTGD